MITLAHFDLKLSNEPRIRQMSKKTIRTNLYTRVILNNKYIYNRPHGKTCSMHSKDSHTKTWYSIILPRLSFPRHTDIFRYLVTVHERAG